MAHGGLAVIRRKGGSKPLAAQWIEFLRAGLGNAFTQNNNSIVGAETITLSRLLANISASSEKLETNFIPGTSSDALFQWAKRLGVTIRSDSTQEDIRAACAAKYRSPSGATRGNINESISALLGDSLVKVFRYYGDETSLYPEVANSFWFGGTTFVDDGNLALDSDGVFCSPISTILVVVSTIGNLNADGTTKKSFLTLMNIHLYDLLDGFLPSWVNWDWVYTDPANGFELDINNLDATAIAGDP